MPPGFAPGKGTYVPHFAGAQFEMRRSGDEFLQVSTQATPQGPERTSTRIDLVLGAGTADDVYLSWRDDERMYELPIAWLWTMKTWGASHFCQPYGQGDFSREATVRCLECHTTWIEHVAGSTNLYRRAGAILGVTCERCHGPGREHVAFHRSQPKAEAAHSIVNPAGLERERRIEVCTQCHSNAITHRRPPFTYRPGEPLNDYFRTLTISHSEDDHVANQIDGLRRSKCFQNSSTMTCITCHDPHAVRGADDSPSTACLACHRRVDCGENDRLAASVKGDCVGCHMPRRIKINVKFETEYDNFVPPIRRYEHRIAVDPIARDSVQLAWCRAQPEARYQEESARLERKLTEHWLAEADDHRRQHRFMAAIAAVREALAVGDAPAAREKLHELVTIQAQLYDDWAKALYQIATNQADEAAQTLEAILKVKPDDAEVHSKLGTIYAMAGDSRRAVSHLTAVAECDPNNAAGYGVLGKLAFRNGQFAEGLDHSRRAAELDPFNAQIEFDIGLALVQLDRLPEAVEHLQHALRIDPTRVDILSSLVDALDQTGRLNDAVEAAERAFELARTGEPELSLPIGRRLEALRARAQKSKLRPARP